MSTQETDDTKVKEVVLIGGLVNPTKEFRRKLKLRIKNKNKSIFLKKKN